MEPSVRFALVGAGSVGRGLYHQAQLTNGVECPVVCDIKLERALGALAESTPHRIVHTVAELEQALTIGETAVCQDALLAAAAPGVDVLLDASTAIETAPATLENAMARGKHVVMMNAEADALLGPYLWEIAQRHGVSYSSCDGDQPAVIARLLDEMTFYGLEIAMVGNIKGFMDRFTDPLKIKPEADKRGLSPKMCSSYTDGTKLCVEMSIVANAIGGKVLQPGMVGPRMKEAIEMFEHFQFRDLWKPGDAPLVDYVLGARPKGGVFAVGYTDDAYQRRMLDWFPPEIGPGPFYMLTRPYHLIHLEAMRTVLEVSRTGRSLMAPRHGMRTEVIAYAKRSLCSGDALDGAGGFAAYGLIENRLDNTPAGFPILLSNNVRLQRDVKAGARITWEDIDVSTVAKPVLHAWKMACNAQQ